MKLVTLTQYGLEEAAVRIGDRVVPVRLVNDITGSSFSTDLFGLIQAQDLDALRTVVDAQNDALAALGTHWEQAEFGPLYRHPRKIWGIGLNYRDHADDLRAELPTKEPASFMKADTTVIGPGDPIRLPPKSKRVTAEAELAIVIGKECKDVHRSRAGRHCGVCASDRHDGGGHFAA